MPRGVRTGLVITLVLALLGVGVLALLTRSDYGRNRVRSFALGRIRHSVNGTVDIGRLEGNVLGDFSLVDVRIADSTGQTFLTADRVSARVNATALFSKRVAISHLTLVKPRIYLIKTPTQDWNYERLFKSERGGTDSTAGFGDWVLLRDVTMVDGAIVLQRPWSPDERFSGVQKDSVIRAALAGETRTRVDRADYGLRQTIDFEKINARLPSVVVADPASRDIVVNVDSLAMIATPFNPPSFDVRQFAGEVRIGPDTVTAPDFLLDLPGTRTKGNIVYMLGNGDMFGSVKADTLTLADIRPLLPILPDSGGGRLNMTVAVRDTGASEYMFTNADIHIGTAQVAGTLGLVIGDSATSLRNTDLAFTRFPTSLIEHFEPSAKSPIAGHLTGRATAEGPFEAMRVNVAATLDPLRHAPFRITARGGLGFGEATTMNRLVVHGERVPVTVANELGFDPHVEGVVTIDATLSGSTASRLRGPYRLVHNENGIISRVDGEGSIAIRDSSRLDVGMNFKPVSLELVEHFIDSTDVRGEVTGTGRLRGTPRSFATTLDLNLPDTGFAHIEGTYRRPNDNVPAYTATVTVRDVDLQTMIPAFPATTIEGVTTIEGRGTRLATVDARVGANLRVLMVDSAEFRDVVVKAAAKDGLVTLDTLGAVASFGSASAAGTFGIVAEREGTLRYRAAISDLAGLRRWIATGDTGLVAARPLLDVRLARVRQYQDSVRREVQMQSNPAAQLAADIRREARPEAPKAAQPLQPIPRDSIFGSIAASGEAKGSVKRFELTGTATTPGIIWGGSLVGAGTVNARWTDAATPNNKVVGDGALDSLRIAGFAFDSTHFKGSYARGEGDVQVSVFPGDTAEYRLDATYALRAREGEVRLREIRLRFDSTAWASTRQSVVRWHGRGITIDSLEMRSRDGKGGARIFVNGEMPDVDPGRIELAVDSLRLAPWLTLLQSDVTADGMLTFRSVMEGTRASPRINATLLVTDPRYRNAAFPEINTKLEYADRTLTVDGRIQRANDGELATIKGTVPLDLSLADSVRTRLLDAPLALTIEGDSIPLSPIAEFSQQIPNIGGRAYGRVAMSGTWKKPRLDGALGVDATNVTVAATGIIVRNLVGRLHMSGDTLVIDSLRGNSLGVVRGSGVIVLTELDRPVFNVTLQSTRAQLLHDERGTLFADANLQITGPLDTLTVNGSLLVRHGVIYIPDPARLDIINTDDPAIFAVVDTATARQLDVAPPSPVMKGLRLDVDIEARRGIFARSPDANVEVYGKANLRIDPSTEGRFAVTGALYTDQGDYTFMGKRFAVTRGSVRFTGETDPNPVLQILATHEVKQAGRPPLDIRVIIGGTMRRPSLSLESEAQPTMSQSDLIAFLAFGQSSASLLQFTNTGLEGDAQGGSSLAGNVGAIARRQMASIALGALVDQARADLAASTRADVVNITPAEVPAELSLGSLQTLLKGTDIEIGKYTDRHTFVLGRVRPSLVIPGASVERRIGQKYTLRGIFETRLQPERPSLSAGLEPKNVQVLGALFLIKLAW